MYALSYNNVCSSRNISCCCQIIQNQLLIPPLSLWLIETVSQWFSWYKSVTPIITWRWFLPRFKFFIFSHVFNVYIIVGSFLVKSCFSWPNRPWLTMHKAGASERGEYDCCDMVVDVNRARYLDQDKSVFSNHPRSCTHKITDTPIIKINDDTIQPSECNYIRLWCEWFLLRVKLSFTDKIVT